MEVKKNIYFVICCTIISIAWIGISDSYAEKIHLSSNKVIPIVIKPNNPIKEISFNIDISPTLFVDIASPSDLFEVTLITPDGQAINPGNVSAINGEYFFGELGKPNIAFTPSFISGFHKIYYIQTPMSGPWKVIITGINLPADGEAFLAEISMDNTLKMGIMTNLIQYLINEPVLLMMSLFDDATPVINATAVATLTNTVTGLQYSITLKDDGNEPDNQSGDGLYSADFIPTEGGDYTVKVAVTGTRNGLSFSSRSYSSFSVRQSIASFNGIFSDRGVDNDNDGLFDSVDLNAGIDIDVTGTYRLSTTLKGNNNNTKTLTVVQELNQGQGQTVNINFSKEDIFEIAVDGPYTVSEITIEILETNNWFSMDKKENAWVTQPYSLTNFEKEGIVLTGNYSDLGIDVNNNELFDTLQVSIELDLLLGGYYNWSAKLVDSYDTEIEFVGKSGALNSGINIINLSFDGNKIGGNGINGPYFVKGLLMFGAGNSLIANEVATTKYYNFTDFEGARIPGDLDGDNDVDRDDVNIIRTYLNQPASACPACDIDGDGIITGLDARKLVMMCTSPRCLCP